MSSYKFYDTFQVFLREGLTNVLSLIPRIPKMRWTRRESSLFICTVVRVGWWILVRPHDDLGTCWAPLFDDLYRRGYPTRLSTSVRSTPCLEDGSCGVYVIPARLAAHRGEGHAGCVWKQMKALPPSTYLACLASGQPWGCRKPSRIYGATEEKLLRVNPRSDVRRRFRRAVSNPDNLLYPRLQV
jgi:hypothetical protein